MANQFAPNAGGMVGDSGTGGVAGLVPAPPAGSAAAGDYLSAAGTWTAPPSAVTGSYLQAYFPYNAQWGTFSASFVAPSPLIYAAPVARFTNGISWAAAGLSLCGIAISPPTTTAVYMVDAVFSLFQEGAAGKYAACQLVTGTSVLSGSPGYNQTVIGTGIQAIPISAIWAPGTTSSISINIQLAASAGTSVFIESDAGATFFIPAEFRICRIV